MISTGDFKRGVRIMIDGDPYSITDVAVQSPSARGASSISKIKVRNLRTGQVLEKSFRGGDKVAEANLEFKAVQFLYSDAGEFHFMDTASYEQFALTTEALGDAAGFLKEGLEGIRSMVMGDEVLGVDLPNTVNLLVTETAPSIKGATAQAQTKPATLETGVEIQVPAYLENGELVQVDTRESRFISRVKG
ncbi:MAG: elongation factor P [Candidatus Binatia bacterium]|jgi:elongation factor P|nr:elongation factor P [Candidatus Binatia bacterium]MDG1957814.1 elongation factor P [Candidatus Binatia bacterium]MDG2008791.1 elongation factor P [Candidatus Binatia bacterium]HAC79067.1 elongation factor P [Deltaproteobacteria bacterium]